MRASLFLSGPFGLGVHKINRSTWNQAGGREGGAWTYIVRTHVGNSCRWWKEETGSEVKQKLKNWRVWSCVLAWFGLRAPGWTGGGVTTCIETLCCSELFSASKCPHCPSEGKIMCLCALRVTKLFGVTTICVHQAWEIFCHGRKGE